MRIAVLDDDPSQLQFVSEALSPAGHNCYLFTEGRALIHRMQRETFDLVTLDWNVLDIQGDQVLAWIRASFGAQLPVLFMTSRGHESDIVTALDAGADDYVVKPVSAAVLAARVTTLLRRTYRQDEAVKTQQFDDFLFDMQEGRVYRRGLQVPLSQKEFQVALLLFRNLARPLSRSHIVETVWKQSPDIPTRTLDTHVSAVRVKLNLKPQDGYRIVPIYGYGYRLEKLDSAAA